MPSPPTAIDADPTPTAPPESGPPARRGVRASLAVAVRWVLSFADGLRLRMATTLFGMDGAAVARHPSAGSGRHAPATGEGPGGDARGGGAECGPGDRDGEDGHDGGADGEPATTPPTRRELRDLVWRPALLGFVALLAIVVGDSFPSSPFKFEMAGVWFFGAPSSGGASRFGVYFVLVAVYGGLLLLMRVWWGMTKLYARRPGVPINKLVWCLALWSLPMLVVAPLFSRDAYSYVAQGEMVSRHMSPYMNGPFQLGNNGWTAPVDPLWGNAPAPYGPLFLQIDGFFARVTFHNELATIVLLRLLALVGVVLIALCVPRLARLYHRDGAELFALMVLNPVVILHFIGGAHNDALMLGLLLAGLTMAKEKRPVVGVVLCALAAAIKAPALLGVIYIGWGWLGPGAPKRDRIRPVVTASLLTLGILGFFSSRAAWGGGGSTT